MYQCLNETCKKQFMHTAKKTKLTITINVDLTHDETMKIQTQNTEGTEKQVCPFCDSLNYNEYTEPQPEITSVKSVELCQVDDYLKLGYVVRELYAKTATLVKSEVAPKDTNPNTGETLTELISNVNKNTEAP